MALFGRKKKDVPAQAGEEAKKAAPAAAAPLTAQAGVAPAKRERGASSKVSAAKATPARNVDAGAVLLRPRITEKAALLSEGGVYSFDVAQGATKADVRRAVAKIFNVHPVKVRMVAVKHKYVVTRSTGKSGRKPGGKKAYVKLKEGEKIELI